jgi:prepilin-type processing-associated H-X9-DG protein
MGKNQPRFNLPRSTGKAAKDRVRHPSFVHQTHLYPGAVNAAWVLERPFWSYAWWPRYDTPPDDRPQRRAGNYAPNSWLANGELWGWQLRERPKEGFRVETEIHDPSGTPVFADGTHDWGWAPHGPRATDLPAIDLVSGAYGHPLGMAAFTLPRHGSRPSKISTNHPPGLRYPGAINVALYDGHVEPIKLDRLWQLYWHKDYQPPVKRPLLK